MTAPTGSVGPERDKREIAVAERIEHYYVNRALRLTLFAPEIVEAILDGRQAEGMTLPALMGPFSLEWDRQRLER